MKKLVKNVIGTVCVLAMLAVSVSIMPKQADAASKVTVKAPYATEATVVKGKQITLVPSKAVSKVNFKSANTKIATVSKKGVVKGKAKGSTTVTVSLKTNAKKKAVVNVTVVTKAVKKVKFSKKTTSLKKGETFAFAAAVTSPKKGVATSLIWASSNKKVASVDENGNVKALAAGTTVISATASDGSKVAAKCTLNVIEPVEVTYAEIVNTNVINVKLNKAEKLDVSQVSVMGKKHAEGRYTRTYDVKGMTSLDDINYYITIDPNETIYYGEYVKITLSTSAGAASKEMKAYFNNSTEIETETIIVGTAGNAIEKTPIIYSNRCIGEAVYEVANLPAGFYTKNVDGTLYICGKGETVSDNVIATATAKDEFGNTTTKNIRFVIGTADKIVTYIEPVIKAVNDDSIAIRKVYTGGGSGEYNYSLGLNPYSQYKNVEAAINLTSGIFTYTNNYEYDETAKKNVTSKTPQGDYTYNIVVTDNKNASITAKVDAKIKLTNGVVISGVLTDAIGQPMANQFVEAECISNETIGYVCSLYPTDKDGKYQITVPENETYNIVSGYAVSFKNKITKDETINIKSPCYKVDVKLPNTEEEEVYHTKTNFDYLNNDDAYKVNLVYWTDVTDSSEDSVGIEEEMINNVMYVLPGKHTFVTQQNLTIKNTKNNVEQVSRATFEITVTNASVSAAGSYLPAKSE